jgi:hypothetical protein
LRSTFRYINEAAQNLKQRNEHRERPV